MKKHLRKSNNYLSIKGMIMQRISYSQFSTFDID
jgi:hypothetical protein